MDRPLPKLLLVGQIEHAEMRPVAECIAEIVPTKQLIRAATISDIAEATGAVFPDVVVICQLWPDEYARGEIEELFARFPLATILVCFGSWCDSDGRNRHLWPPATRVPAAASAILIRRVWEDAVAGLSPLPKTAAIEEVYLRQHAGALAHIGRDLHGPVTVASADPAIRAWLTDALRAAKFHVADDCRDSSLPQAAIWDAPVWDHRASSQLRQFRDAHSGIPLVVLIGGLRPHQQREAMQWGADCVLPKIAPIDVILESLAALMRDRAVIQSGA